MKKIFTLFALLPVSFLSAQITISQSDIGTINTVVIRSTDTVPSVLPGNSGASQTWNLTNVVTHMRDTTTFASPSQAQFSSSFPSSNMAVMQRGQMDFDAFCNISSTSLRLNGQGGDPAGIGINAAFTLSPYETVINFPGTYQSTFNETVHGHTKFYLGIDPGIGFVIDTVQIRSIISKSSDIDGWGSVTTPLNTYNALRQNVLRVQYDTIDLFAQGIWMYDFFMQQDSNRVYSWWANGMAWPVAELTDAQDLGTITRASWISQPLTAVGVAEQTAMQEAVPAYPNPASSLLYITRRNGGEQVLIYDMSGRLLKTEKLRSDINGIDVQEMSGGLYLFTISDASGKPLEHGRFTVAR